MISSIKKQNTKLWWSAWRGSGEGADTGGWGRPFCDRQQASWDLNDKKGLAWGHSQCKGPEVKWAWKEEGQCGWSMESERKGGVSRSSEAPVDQREDFGYCTKWEGKLLLSFKWEWCDLIYVFKSLLWLLLLLDCRGLGPGVEVVRLAQRHCREPGQQWWGCRPLQWEQQRQSGRKSQKSVPSAWGNSASPPGYSVGSVLPSWCSLSFFPPLVITLHLLLCSVYQNPPRDSELPGF